jgi:hypothetical protein
MRSWERALAVLEALCERGQAAGHGWTLDTELLPPHQQQVNVLENQGLVELACREDRAELSVLEGRPVRWAARLPPYGHDTLAYGQSRPRAEPSPGEAASDRQLLDGAARGTGSAEGRSHVRRMHFRVIMFGGIVRAGSPEQIQRAPAGLASSPR